jgi:predicted DsbA family dithiol-disulfide isomerase
MAVGANFVSMRSVLSIVPLLALLFTHAASGQEAPKTRIMKEQQVEPASGRLVVEVWSDIVCPFCYIGKREFEAAMERFPQRDSVEVVWRSFELDPRAPQRSPLDMYGMLVEKYGGTRADAKARVDGVVQRAKGLGLVYNMDIAVIGSSFDAHRLLQFAKTKGKGDEAKERLFKAYFTEGAHLADHATLVRLGLEIGLDPKELERMLRSDAYAEAVRADERAGHAAGVRGVPYFRMAGTVVVSGAQQSDAFLQALEQAWRTR